MKLKQWIEGEKTKQKQKINQTMEKKTTCYTMTCHDKCWVQGIFHLSNL